MASGEADTAGGKRAATWRRALGRRRQAGSRLAHRPLGASQPRITAASGLAVACRRLRGMAWKARAGQAERPVARSGGGRGQVVRYVVARGAPPRPAHLACANVAHSRRRSAARTWAFNAAIFPREPAGLDGPRGQPAHGGAGARKGAAGRARAQSGRAVVFARRCSPPSLWHLCGAAAARGGGGSSSRSSRIARDALHRLNWARDLPPALSWRLFAANDEHTLRPPLRAECSLAAPPLGFHFRAYRCGG